jgi:hypothetical protein
MGSVKGKGTGRRTPANEPTRTAERGSVGGREFPDQVRDLLLEELGGSVVQQDIMGQLNFSPKGQLLGNSPLGERSCHTALLQPGQLLVGRTGDADGEIKPILQVLFEEQGHLDHPADAGVGGQALTPDLKQRRMGQLLEPEALRVVGKHDRAEVHAVDCAVGQEGLGAKVLLQGGADFRARIDVLSHQGVRIEATEAMALKQAGGSGFAAPETSRQS